MNLSVLSLMLACILIPCVQSDGCQCKFPDERYSGMFRLFGSVKNDQGQITKVDKKGNFNVDLTGYYFRAYLDHPTFGPMYFYKENEMQVICYENTTKCVENAQDLFFVFPKCLPNEADWGDTDLYYNGNMTIGGVPYRVFWEVNEEHGETKICLPYVFTWYDNSSRGGAYQYTSQKPYAGLTVDTTRDLQFFRAEITNKFPGVVNF